MKSVNHSYSHSQILLNLSTLFHLQTLAKSFSHCPYFPLLPSRWSLPLASSLQQTSLTKVNYDLHATKSNRNFSGIRFSHFSAAFDPGDGFHHLETCSPLGCRVLMFILPPLPFFLSNVCWLIASTWPVNVAVTRAGLCSFFPPVFLEWFSSFLCLTLYCPWVS